jgi:hypothetical protein
VDEVPEDGHYLAVQRTGHFMLGGKISGTARKINVASKVQPFVRLFSRLPSSPPQNVTCKEHPFIEYPLLKATSGRFSVNACSQFDDAGRLQSISSSDH